MAATERLRCLLGLVAMVWRNPKAPAPPQTLGSALPRDQPSYLNDNETRAR